MRLCWRRAPRSSAFGGVQQFALKRFAGYGEHAGAEVVQGVQILVVGTERPAPVGEYAFIGLGLDHLHEKGVVGFLRVGLFDEPAFQPGNAAL